MKAKAVLVGILLLYFGLALGYGAANPPFEGSEERNQFRYVRYLVEKRQLPQLQPGKPSENHQPPLYYALAAVLTGWLSADDFPTPVVQDNPFRGYHYWETGVDNKNQFLHGPWDDPRYSSTALAVRLIRGLSALLGLGTVLLTYLLALEITQGQRAVALGAMACVAFNPMFLYINGSMGNDSAAALTGAAILLAAARLMQRKLDKHQALLLGVALGLGWLSKITTLLLLPAVELGLTLAAFQQRSWQAWLRANLIAFSVALALSGWMFARNIILYNDPTGVRQDFAVWGMRSFQEGMAVLPYELHFAWTTFWGRFGWGDVPLPDLVYNLLYALVGLACVGLVIYFIKSLSPSRRQNTNLAPFTMLLLAAGTLIAALVWFTIHSATGNFGRYTFSALSAIGVLLFWGWANLIPRRWWPVLSAVYVTAMLGLAAFALWGVLRPAYAPPPLLTAAQRQQISRPLDVTLGGKARLLGYDLDRDHAAPGERVYLTLYWQSVAPFDRNYVLFVHLLSDAGPLVAQRDTHPGLGRYPTQAWQVSYAFADRIPLDIPSTAYTPDQARLYIGLYNPETGERLAVPGERDNVLPLAPFQVERAPGEYPLATNFNNEITLVDYTLSARSLSAGQALTLTLYWLPAQPIAYDYAIFTHVLGQENHTWAVNDGTPNTAPRQTSQWVTGQLYQDTRVLRLAPDTPPGIYPIEMGWFGGLKGGRLPIMAADGRSLDDRIMLTQIKVTAP